LRFLSKAFVRYRTLVEGRYDFEAEGVGVRLLDAVGVPVGVGSGVGLAVDVGGWEEGLEGVVGVGVTDGLEVKEGFGGVGVRDGGTVVLGVVEGCGR